MPVAEADAPNADALLLLLVPADALEPTAVELVPTAVPLMATASLIVRFTASSR